MKFLTAALTGMMLLGAAAAQNDRGPEDRAQEHGGPPPNSAPRRGPHHIETLPAPTNPRIGQGPFSPDHQGMERGRHPDWDRLHGNFHAEQRFHAEPWHPPRDYQYRRWAYGERLPPSYFGRDLWIMRFALYGLLTPPPDAVWVRSGPDALLVDRDTGEIIRVQYGVFY